MPNKVMNPFEWLLLIILSVLWGGSFFFGEVALMELRPFTVVLGRVALAAIAKAQNSIVINESKAMEAQARLKAWPKLQQDASDLANSLELRYRIFAVTDDARITLYEAGYSKVPD